MRRWTGMFTAAILCGGMLFGASGQINLNAPTMNLNATRMSLGANGTIGINAGLNMTLNANSAMRLYSNSRIGLYAPIVEFGEYRSYGMLTAHWGDLKLYNTTTGDGGTLQANRVDVLGSLYLSGSKHFIHPHPTDDSQLIRYIAIESGEALTVARGVARTENGRVTITLPEHFSMVTSRDEPITVNLTPEGAPVVLYVQQKSREQITVAMRNSDFAEFRDVEFSYQITGVRDGFENQEVIIGMDELFGRNTRTNARQSDGQRRIEAFEERLRAMSMERVEEFIRKNETENSERGSTDEN